MSVWRRRFWDGYNVVIFLVAIGFGVFSVAGGSVRGVVTGLGLIVVSLWLLVRVVRLQRARRGAERALPAPRVSHLELGAESVQVLSGTADRPGRAALRWSDCVAVVASPASVSRSGAKTGTGWFYVHFMAASDDRVLLEGMPDIELRELAEIVGQPPSPAAGCVWLFTAESLPEIASLLEAVARRAPHARIIDSIHRSRKA